MRRLLTGLLAVSLLACGSSSPDPSPEPSTTGVCGTELRESTQARIDAANAVGAYTSDVRLPVAPPAESHPYEDIWRRVSRGEDGWRIDGEAVESLADALTEPHPRVMFSVPADMPARVLADAVAPHMRDWYVRLNVVEPRFAEGEYLSPDAIHAELRRIGEDCAPLRSLQGADSAMITSGMADGAFEGINECCGSIDAARVEGLMHALRRPHRWVPIPTGDPEGKTVQEWLDGPPGAFQMPYDCSAWAGRGPDECNETDIVPRAGSAVRGL